MEYREQFETIEIPENIEQIITDAVQLGAHRQIIRRWKKVAYSCIGVAVGLLVAIGVGNKVPMVASAMEKIPIIKEISAFVYEVQNYKKTENGTIYYYEED